MPKKTKIAEAEPIPAAAWGPGCHMDPKTNTLYGANGEVYTDVMVSYRDFCKICNELGIPHPPRPKYDA